MGIKTQKIETHWNYLLAIEHNENEHDGVLTDLLWKHLKANSNSTFFPPAESTG